MVVGDVTTVIFRNSDNASFATTAVLLANVGASTYLFPSFYLSTADASIFP